MKVVSLTLSLCLALSSGMGQPRSSPIAKAGPSRLSAPFQAPIFVQSPDTLRVLALMVQFKKDVDSRTSGDGSFMLTGSPNQIDPPPHDSTFVANKLRFLTNYYRKVSNGSLTLLTEVFSPQVTLADSMAAYSPQRAGSDEPLGKLIVDSWSAANTANPSFPFSLYDVFILLHAGVGRDINVISILGFDPTPYDLPSLVVDLPALRELLKDPSYAGVPVNGGTFHIGHSLILPETETRVFNQSDTLQLSTNGLFAASLGSYLGLPDLFDTKTGRSGIGQFGLMDGASIFAYNGLFPPEPSAWEKIRLGWAVPFEITDSAQTVSLPAVGLTNSGQDSILKIPITASEYFLIENRFRDPNVNGQTLTLVQNGTDVTRYFGSDTTGFFFNDVRAISGSLVDVEDFDWAIPGDMTQAGYEGGGILLWHIDEHVIAANIAANTVNADPLRRGVDLEEADGSQDIGQAYEFLQPGSGTESGWPLDHWFAGNVTPTYRNVFDETSFPNTKSNSGALSHVAMSNFGPKAPRMFMTAQIGNTQFQRVKSLGFQFSPSLRSNPPTVISTAIVLTSDDSVFVFRKNGLPKTGSPDGLLSPVGGRFPLAAVEGIRTYLIGAQDSTLFIWDLDTTTAGVSSSVTLLTVTLGAIITSGPMILDSLGTLLVILGAEDGSVWKIGLDGTIHGSVTGSAFPVTALLANPAVPGAFYHSAQNSLNLGSVSVTLPPPLQWEIAGGEIPGGVMVVAAEKGGKRIIAFDGTLGTTLFGIQVEDPILDLIVADVDNDGRNDAVVTAGTKIFAYNFRGILLDHFPYRLADGGMMNGSPLVADIDGNGTRDLIFRSTRGVASAHAADGRMIAGFPLQMGPAGEGSMSLMGTEEGLLGMLSVNESGSVSAWKRNLAYNPVRGEWHGFRSDAAHGGFNAGPSTVPGIPVSGFLPKERVYNWPNPVYGSSTNIRYFTTEPAKIIVRIFDLSGESVAELKGDSPGGIDSEIVWDVSGIQSGVYFAHVEASTGSRTDALIFKIAVVR